MLSKYSKRIWIVAVTGITLCMANRQAASAGDINSNEQGVLDAAGSIFYYGGEAYAAEDIYLQQLRQELMEDDVDLTAKEADKYIAKIYGSIKEGIDEGYLVKVKSSTAAGGSGEEKQEAASGDNAAPSGGQAGESENTEQAGAAAGQKDGGQGQEDKKEEAGQDNKKEDGKDDSGSGTENANQEPDDGMDTASAGEKNVPDGEAVTEDGAGTDENASVFSFLDADETKMEAGGALAGEGAADGGADAKDASHTYGNFFADVLMLLLAAAAAGSAYLLYKQKNITKKEQESNGT